MRRNEGSTTSSTIVAQGQMAHVPLDPPLEVALKVKRSDLGALKAVDTEAINRAIDEIRVQLSEFEMLNTNYREIRGRQGTREERLKHVALAVEYSYSTSRKNCSQF